jgi:hypothetical protein
MLFFRPPFGKHPLKLISASFGCPNLVLNFVLVSWTNGMIVIVSPSISNFGMPLYLHSWSIFLSFLRNSYRCLLRHKEHLFISLRRCDLWASFYHSPKIFCLLCMLFTVLYICSLVNALILLVIWNICSRKLKRYRKCLEALKFNNSSIGRYSYCICIKYKP